MSQPDDRPGNTLLPPKRAAGGIQRYIVASLLLAALGAGRDALLSTPNGPTVGGTGDLILLTLFVATGLGIAGLIKRMHAAEDGRETAAALSSVRAERLDAIINTTVDGIILIDARGRIETFNRGAERLFGYPESEVIGRNVSMLMPSPYHEEHDEYLNRYLTTGQARIIGKVAK